MSTFTVPVALVDKIEPHANADNLELAQVLGWQLVVRKGQYTPGDRVVYFPPDTMMSQELSDKIGVTQYLHKQRVSCARLRGEPSFGIAITPDDPTWEVGQDVASHYGVYKYEPPRRLYRFHGQIGQPKDDFSLPYNPLFPKYTRIENMRLFPSIFEEGERVFLTEKIHGTNSRIGLVEGEWMAGSHNIQKKQPDPETPLEKLSSEQRLYWHPYSLPEVRTLIEQLTIHYEAKQVIIYGEIYGASIQSYHYGKQGNALGYRVFDIMVDGKYLPIEMMRVYCLAYDVETVPLLAEGPFSRALVKNSSCGTTTLVSGDDPTKTHLREGVVVRPQYERTHPTIGRVILKYVSDDYLLDRKKTDWNDNI